MSEPKINRIPCGRRFPAVSAVRQCVAGGGELQHCIICGSLDKKTLYEGILQCPGCGHVYADLKENVEEIFDIYNQNYFLGDEYRDYVADKAVIQKNFGRRLRVLTQFADPEKYKHLLEIGCAYGFFLELANAAYDNVSGMDISENGVAYARERLKLNAVQADFLTHDLGNARFDLVCLWDTIEHLLYPNLYIEKIGRFQKKNALVAITTGDIDSLNARIRREKWRLIHPPTHIHYFSKKSLSKLLEKFGFEPLYIRYCGFYRSMDTIAYTIFVLQGKSPSIYRALCRTGITAFDIYLNTYDIIYVIARKR